MTFVLFIGPTLSSEEARAVLPSVVLRPPATCGDVYRAARSKPTAIAICDGYFDHRLSVWHKEILWALSRGIRVYGASSMGALRAAELEPFGMIGVGAIFDEYRSGVLEDDDEVAVIHDSPEFGYRPRSEALVNIRATLRAAAREGIVTARTAQAVIAAAKSLFYPERTYERAIDLACGVCSTAELDELRRWLRETPTIDQKRLDAFALVQRMRDDSEAPELECARADFCFEETDAWRAFREGIDSEAMGPTPASAVFDRRENPPSHGDLRVETLERTLALVLAELDQETATSAEVQKVSEEFRRKHGLLSPERTSEWLEKHQLDREGFSLLMYNEVLIQRLRPGARALVDQQLKGTLQALNLDLVP